MSTRTPPSTELRNFYWFLRESSLRYVLNPLQKLFCPNGQPSDEAVSMVAGLFSRSINQFSEYKNLTEDFRPATGRRKSEEADTKFAKRIVSLLRENSSKITIEGSQSLPKYVDREISPIRTTRAKVPATGLGGVDFLAATLGDRPIPVIGEVKADSDKTPLFALIQALTYAVELATPHQADRLQRSYPDFFPATFSEVELLVVVEGSRSNTKKERYDEVCKFAAALMDKREVAQKIRNISFWWGQVENGCGNFTRYSVSHKQQP